MSTYGILQTPQKYSPAYNQLIYVVESSNAAQPNMRYIAQIYQASLGTAGALIATVKQYPLADGNAVFDLHRILENYVSWDLTIDGTSSPSFIENENSYYGYIVKFGEEYGTIGALTTTLAIHSDSQRFIFNGIFDFPDFAVYNKTDWLIAAGTQKKFLTNQPLARNIRLGTKDWLYCMEDTDVIDHALITVVDQSGSITTHNMTNTYGGLGLAADAMRFLRLTSGPANLGALGVWILSTTAYYTVVLKDSSGNSISETIQYNIVDTLPKYPYYRLHFLNKLGGFDSYDFGKVSHIKTDTIARQSYERVIGSESGGAWSFGKQDLVVTPFDIQTRQLVTIQSDWITDPESIWLQELVTSPLVFLESTDASSLVAVNIETTSYEQRQKANEKTINIVLDISFGYKLTRQRQ